MSEHYDYFVIGAGSGGVRSARIAAGHGAKVGIAEESKLGGTCVNLGCVPKKIMVTASDFGQLFRDSQGFGWSYKDLHFDWKKLISRKNDRIRLLNEGFKETLEKAGVDIHYGKARFVDQNTLDIDGKTVTADKIMIAVGGTPKSMDIPGIEHCITSNEFFHLPEQPKRAVIIGGGYVAVEFAHILQNIGTQTTLLYYKELFLRSFDDDLSKTLADEMRKKGTELCFNCNIERVEKTQDGLKVFTKEGHEHACDSVILAVGRHPKFDGLNLEASGVALDEKGYIKVDEHYKTSVAHIYAVGDVTNTYHLTPVAIAEGHIVADRLFGTDKNRKVDYTFVPTVIFSDPTIGTIGLSEEQARAQGIEISVYKTKFTPPRHRMADRDEEMLMKLVVDKKDDRVIGCHVIGFDVAEMMQGFGVAMNAGATKADFDRTIAIHPTVSEELVLMKNPVASD